MPPLIEPEEFANLPTHECERLYLNDNHELYCLYFGKLIRTTGNSDFKISGTTLFLIENGVVLSVDQYQKAWDWMYKYWLPGSGYIPDDQTPVIDIKPYHPATDRVKDVRVPDWCSHWPQYYEENETFDWQAEFVNA